MLSEIGLGQMKARRGPGRRPADEGNAEDTRRAIFAHAMRLFNERGYLSVSMTDIAGAAGLTKATLYYHFPGKAELLAAGAQDMIARVRDNITRICADRSASVRDRLTRLVRERYDRPAFNAYNAALMDEAMQHLSPEQRGLIREAFASLGRPIAELMREGIARGELRPMDPDVLAEVFRRLFSVTAQRRNGRDGADFDQGLLDVFFAGCGSA